MPRRRPNSYLKTNRLKAALSQAELGKLLGFTADAVSKYELEQRGISAKVLIATEIIFGASAADLFPALYEAVEEELGPRALSLHGALAGREDPASKKKRALIEAIPARLRAASNL